MRTLRALLDAPAEGMLPELVVEACRLILGQIDDATARIDAIEARIVALHRGCAASRRVATIPGIGPITASALMAFAPDAARFSSARQFAAWLGLVPAQHATGGKERLGRITKTGNQYLRKLLVIGATGLIRYRRATVPGGRAWLQGLLARKPVRLVSVALANKMARIVWAVLAPGERYRAPSPAEAASDAAIA